MFTASRELCHAKSFVLRLAISAIALLSIDGKVAGVKVYPRQTWNFRSLAVSACIGLWHHRLMHARTACIASWCHRPMHAVTALARLFWFHLRYTFTSSYFDRRSGQSIDIYLISLVCLLCFRSGKFENHRWPSNLWQIIDFNAAIITKVWLMIPRQKNATKVVETNNELNIFWGF